MKLFLAGTFIAEELTKKYKPLYVLESFYYIKPWQIQEMSNWKMFLLDSGAFTFLHAAERKRVDWDAYLSKYIAFIKANGIEYFFELDIDAIVGYESVKAMRRRLESETERRCIPVWHRSRGLEEFKRLCKEYPYIGIGGFAIKTILPNEFPFVRKLIQIAAGYGTKVHGLGYTRKDAPEFGFFSVDSTTWSTAVSFGSTSYFDGQKIVTVRPPPGKMGETTASEGNMRCRNGLNIKNILIGKDSEWINKSCTASRMGWTEAKCFAPPTRCGIFIANSGMAFSQTWM